MDFSKFGLQDFVDIFDIIWVDRMQTERRWEAYESEIFKVLDIPSNSGDRRLMDEIDREEYTSAMTEGGQADTLRYQQGYSKYLLAAPRQAKDYTITYEFRTQNKYEQVVRNLTSMIDLPMNRLDLDLSHRVSFATATSYIDKDGNTVDLTLGDGLALLSTAHTVRASSSTYRNRLANNPRLSRGSLEAMERMAKENSINMFGEKLTNPMLDVLFTTDDPEDINIAMEYLESVGSPDFDNNKVVNVYSRKYRHVVLPRVATDASGVADTSKRHYWGLVSTEDFQAYLGFWEHPRNIGVLEADDGSENFLTGVRTQYGITIVVARGFNMSTGDGAA